LDSYLCKINLLLVTVNAKLAQFPEDKIILADILVSKISVEQVNAVVKRCLRGKGGDVAAVVMLRFITALDDLELIRERTSLNLTGKKRASYFSYIFYDNFQAICKVISPESIRTFDRQVYFEKIEALKKELKIEINTNT